MTPCHDATRAGIVALAGPPNVGKSTLLNHILGRHLSIATPKPQTTRTRVLGVASHDNVQIVYTDTPGIHTPHSPIQQRMVGIARAGMRGSDLTCWLVAADRGLSRVDQTELARLAEHPAIVVLNKSDLVKREALLPLIDRIATMDSSCPTVCAC